MYKNEIRQYRHKECLTLYDLADLIGMSQASVWQWEKGYSMPKPKQIRQLADALQTTIDALYPIDKQSDAKRLPD